MNHPSQHSTMATAQTDQTELGQIDLSQTDSRPQMQPRDTVPKDTAVRATARLQLHANFTLADAARQVDYYAALGISHLYLSPIFTALPDSMHGYDVTDFATVHPALGGEDALRELVTQLRAKQMGLVIDIVPNHMAASVNHNHWWRDVLAQGRLSPYAGYFDIDWEVPDPTLRHKLLLPILGQPYGAALDAAEISLHFDAEHGLFELHYFDTHLPVAMHSYPSILREDPGHRFEAMASQFSQVAQYETARRLLTGNKFSALLLDAFDSRTPSGRSRLHDLLQQQHYRLAWWRTAADEINWRRFFEISDLVALRIEQDEVFEATHELVFRLYGEGLIDGVRVDHVDGLTDPAAYCRRLKSRLQALAGERAPHAPALPPYVVIEKILAEHESLCEDWEVDGTTGYEFMNDVSAVLHNPAGEAALSAQWHVISGSDAPFADYERAARLQILGENFCSERDSVVRYLHQLARLSPVTQDFTHTMIGRALDALLLHFPVYRSYFGPAGMPEADRALLHATLVTARQTLRVADLPVLAQLEEWLAGVPQADPIAEALRLRAIARFQQLSSPLAAKSVEDTAFYRYGRLISRNEVGSKPDQFALDATAFHARIAQRAHAFPHGMLATATHDHKRGADTRMRLAVLSEIPDAWREALQTWQAGMAPAQDGAVTVTDIAGASSAASDEGTLRNTAAQRPQLDAIDQSMLFQTLVGAWPLNLPAVPGEADRTTLFDLIKRVSAWQTKTLREAKRHSSWIIPNENYEAAGAAMLEELVQKFGLSNSTLTEIGRFVHRIAATGALNSLAQTTLHLTTPGVPDIYQGSENWDFSLVDPDNRRAVDYTALSEALYADPSWQDVLNHWHDGRVKQKLVRTLLECRRAHPALFAMGDYHPLFASGTQAPRTLAFARQYNDTTLIVVVSRFAAPLLGALDVASIDAEPLNAVIPRIPPALWQDTELLLPATFNPSTWRDVLTGASHGSNTGALKLSDLLHSLPVAVLLG